MPIAKIAIRNPDLERFEKLIQLLERNHQSKQNYQTSRQLSEISECIQGCPLLAKKFCHMSNQVLRRVLELIEIKNYQSGELIHRKGTEADIAHLVLYGEVFLFGSSDGKDAMEIEAPSKEELALASRSSSNTMKKLKVGGLVGHEFFAGDQ